MPFKQINTNDQNLEMIQANIAAALPADACVLTISVASNGNQSADRAERSGLFSGGTLIVTPLTSGQDNLIPHGLNRLPLVWVVMGNDTNATIWSPTTTLLKNTTGASQSANESYLNLRCSSSCNVKVWVN